jgi:hypothetical protein
MKFAETAGSRCALVLSTLVTGAVLVAAWPTAAAERTAPREPVRKMHGCGARAAVVAPPPVQAEDPYVVTLRSARDGLAACISDHPELQVRVAIDVDLDGSVSNVEVRAISDNVANIDLHIVKCVQTQVSSLHFPAAANTKRISTFLRQ